MKPRSFQELYLSELVEMRSVEAQMAESLGSLAERATDKALSEFIRSHKTMTEAHRDRIGALIEDHGRKPGAHVDGSMASLIEEARKWAETLEEGAVRDAGLIASLQRLEHYEIAVLGSLASWAQRLGHRQDASTLGDILAEDKETDARLTEIAEEAVNRAAA